MRTSYLHTQGHGKARPHGSEIVRIVKCIRFEEIEVAPNVLGKIASIHDNNRFRGQEVSQGPCDSLRPERDGPEVNFSISCFLTLPFDPFNHVFQAKTDFLFPQLPQKGFYDRAHIASHADYNGINTPHLFRVDAYMDNFGLLGNDLEIIARGLVVEFHAHCQDEIGLLHNRIARFSSSLPDQTHTQRMCVRKSIRLIPYGGNGYLQFLSQFGQRCARSGPQDFSSSENDGKPCPFHEIYYFLYNRIRAGCRNG